MHSRYLKILCANLSILSVIFIRTRPKDKLSNSHSVKQFPATNLKVIVFYSSFLNLLPFLFLRCCFNHTSVLILAFSFFNFWLLLILSYAIILHFSLCIDIVFFCLCHPLSFLSSYVHLSNHCINSIPSRRMLLVSLISSFRLISISIHLTHFIFLQIIFIDSNGKFNAPMIS